MKSKNYLGLIKSKTSKMDILIFCLAIAVIAVGMGPQF